MSNFQNVREAIDGTNIIAHVPSQHQAAYQNRKGVITGNMIAGHSLDRYVFYVCPGWGGSANDTRVLGNADLHGFPRDENAVYLANAGYGVYKGILTPYRIVCYHLQEQEGACFRPLLQSFLLRGILAAGNREFSNDRSLWHSSWWDN